MPNLDRGMIKWMPFNSVIPSKQMVREILNQKNKIKMPILDEEQKQTIEKQIIESFYENNKVNIDYFYNGKIYTLSGYIKKIDSIYHKIYFNNQILLFDQIIKLY